MDEKCVFPKILLDYLGVHKQVEQAHFEPMLSNFGPSQGRQGLENWPIWDHKWLKNGSKPWFSKNDPSPLVVPKHMYTAHFEPLLSRSHPLFSAYLICRGDLLDDDPSPTSSFPIFNPG